MDHARRSAHHCVKALLSAQTHTYVGSPVVLPKFSNFSFGKAFLSSMLVVEYSFLMIFRYDYLPYFYSRVFEYEGSPRKVWWQFFGDNGTDEFQPLPHLLMKFQSLIALNVDFALDSWGSS